MSESNVIICMGCGQRMSLGKYFCYTEGHPDGLYIGGELQWGLEGIAPGLDPNQKNIAFNEYLYKDWLMLQHFLIKHRGHELRLLPWSTVESYDHGDYPKEEDFIVSTASIEAFLSQPVGNPDTRKDDENVPASVRARLKKLSERG
jgi:hypothetical protein